MKGLINPIEHAKRHLRRKPIKEQPQERVMTKCGYCGSTIVIGGVSANGQRYCNSKCRQGAYVLSITKNVAPDVLDRKVEEVWRGNCPKCRGLGPVDVHKVYEVWSALVLTRWTTKAQISCHSCAVKRQLGGAVFSLLFGWWGFPWGLVLTPVQIARNLTGMVKGPDRAKPSDALRRAVLVRIGSELISKAAASQGAQVK